MRFRGQSGKETSCTSRANECGGAAADMPDFAEVRFAMAGSNQGDWTLFLKDDLGVMHEITVAATDQSTIRPIISDGGADSARVLAGMWTRWMAAAATNAESSAMASTQLGRTPIRRTPSTARCSRSRCCVSCWRTSPAPARRSWPACTCARCSASGSSSGRIVVCPANLVIEVGRRLRAILRRRAAPDHRQHRPRACGRHATTCGSSPSNSRR